MQRRPHHADAGGILRPVQAPQLDRAFHFAVRIAVHHLRIAEARADAPREEADASHRSQRRSLQLDAAAIKHALAPLAIGADPLEPEVLWHRMYHHTRDYGQKGAVIGAISAIDIACWDIAGKARAEPVARLLGGMFRQRVQAYATGF